MSTPGTPPAPSPPLPTPVLEPWFAVPVARTRLPDCEALNAELEALFLAREDDAHRNPSPTHLTQQELYESRFDLLQWPDPPIARLRAFMIDGIARTIVAATGMPPAVLARLTLHNHTWFHVTRRGGSFVAHNHPMASWSAVYCVRAGEPVADRPDSGVLRFFDPRAGADAYRDPANARFVAPYVLGSRELRLASGELVVFPSYLAHEVAPFHGPDRRITVATNCWFS